jgi:hypothetical protein
MRIWLDDERKMPPDFDTWVKTETAAIRLVRTKKVSYISFDHDLGEGGSGYKVATFIEKEAFYDRLPRISWAVHSQNPVGKQNIMKAMNNADRYWTDMETKCTSSNIP